MSFHDGLGVAFLAGIFFLVLFATLFPEEKKNPSPNEMGEEQNESNQE